MYFYCMSKKIYNKGDEINNLIFIKELPEKVQPSGNRKRMAILKCKCGSEFKAYLYSALGGVVKNCQECGKKETGRKNTKHGLVKNPVYWIWSDIKRRCYNKNSKGYLSYGAKGITMQSEWINDVKLFFNYVSNLPNYDENNLGMGKLTIDRIDCKKGYVEKNLRWVDATMQNINKPLQKNNKTGYRAISKRPHGTYQVNVRYRNKSNYLGTFKTVKEALKARNEFLTKIGIYKEYTKYE